MTWHLDTSGGVRMCGSVSTRHRGALLSAGDDLTPSYLPCKRTPRVKGYNCPTLRQWVHNDLGNHRLIVGYGYKATDFLPSRMGTWWKNCQELTKIEHGPISLYLDFAYPECSRKSCEAVLGVSLKTVSWCLDRLRVIHRLFLVIFPCVTYLLNYL